MNPNDYYFHSFKQIGAQIDRINKFYQSPIADFAMHQQALYESMGSTVRQQAFYHFPDSVTNFVIHQQELYNSLIANVFTEFHEPFGMLVSQSALHTDCITNALKEIMTPLQQMASDYSRIYGAQFSELVQTSTHSVLSDNFAPLLDSLLQNNHQEMNQKLKPCLKSLAPVIDNIQVHEDYVEVPPELFSPNTIEEPVASIGSFRKTKAVSISSTKQPHWLVQIILSTVLSAVFATGFQQIVNIPAERHEQKWREEVMEKWDQTIQLLSKKGPSTNLTTIMLLDMTRPVTNLVLATPTVPEQSDSELSCTECHSADPQSNTDLAEPDSHPAESQPSIMPDSPDEPEKLSQPD